jgi:hypothetical protein
MCEHRFAFAFSKNEGSYICILMADVHTKEQRSFNMSRIKARDTKPEMLCAAFYMPMDFVISCMMKVIQCDLKTTRFHIP